MKHLITLALGGMLGVCLLAGDASACHKKKCGCGAPAACAPVVCAQPAPCARPVKTACAPRVKKCGGGGGLFAGLCHKKQRCAPAPCGPVVAYNYAPTYYGAPTASGQYMTSPQTMMPQVPAKGTPQR